MTYTIGQTVEVTSVTGSVETGTVVGFKKQRGNDFKFHWFAIVEFETQASDGVYKWREYISTK